MTVKEGIELLNKIANNLLGYQGDKRKHWFCITCNRRVTKLFSGVHKRHGHKIKKINRD